MGFFPSQEGKTNAIDTPRKKFPDPVHPKHPRKAGLSVPPVRPIPEIIE
jgi:hypothetical protein